MSDNLKTCTNCKYWEPPAPLDKPLLTKPGRIGSCNLQSSGSWDQDEDISFLTAVARDYKNECAVLETHEHHYCNEHNYIWRA